MTRVVPCTAKRLAVTKHRADVRWRLWHYENLKIICAKNNSITLKYLLLLVYHHKLSLTSVANQITLANMNERCTVERPNWHGGRVVRQQIWGEVVKFTPSYSAVHLRIQKWKNIKIGLHLSKFSHKTKGGIHYVVCSSNTIIPVPQTLYCSIFIFVQPAYFSRLTYSNIAGWRQDVWCFFMSSKKGVLILAINVLLRIYWNDVSWLNS